MAVNREQVIQTAEKLASRGKVEAAIKEYRKIIDEAPGDTQSLNRVGDLWVRLARNDEAIRLFKQTAEVFSNDGFFVRAIAIYKKIVKLDPTRLEAYERLAELYHKQGLTNEARTQYQVLVDYYLKHGNAASAIAILLKMAVLEPDNPTHHVKLAEVYQQQKLLDKAMGEYRVIAELMLRKGHVDEATQVYLRALSVNATDLGFVRDAVIGLREAGHVGQAARLLAAAVDRNPEAESLARVAGLARVSPENRTGAFVLVPPPEPAPAPVTPPAPPPAAPPPAAASSPAIPQWGAVSPVEEAFARLANELQVEPLAAADGALELDLDADLTLDAELEPPAAQAPIALPSGGASAPPPIAAGAPPAVAASSGAPASLDTAEFELDLEELESFGAPAGSSFPAAPEVEAPQEIEWSFSEPEPVAPTPSVRFDPDSLERTAAEIRPPALAREEDLVAEAEVLSKYGLQEKALERLRQALQLNPRHFGAHAHSILVHLEQGRHERVLALAQQLGSWAAAGRHADAWRQLTQRLQRAGYTILGDRVAGAPAAARGAAGPELLPPLELPSGLPPITIPAAGTPRKAPKKSSVDAALAELTSQARKPPRAAPRPPAAPPVAIPPVAAAAAPEGMELAAEPELRLPEPLPQGAKAPPRAEAVAPAPPVPREEKLFDDEDEFFDLAAELERELEEADAGVVPGQAQEQTLEEIVEGFKKGVAESLSAEDYDTHFNLGIAYREMGLIDEAIGEFQLSAKSPSYLVDCCSMLGLCFLDKGLPELAVKWYRRGLEAPDLAEEQTLGLLYDLGNALETGGDRESAYKTLVEIYGINSNYRDVVARLEDLGRR